MTDTPKSNPTAPPVEEDWALTTWRRLSERSRSILVRRADGMTLDQIGRTVTPPLSRERVRQLESRANTRLRAAQIRNAATLPDDLADATGKGALLTTAAAATTIGTRSEQACVAILVALGYQPLARSDVSPLRDHWSLHPNVLRELLTRLAGLLPLTHTDTAQAAADLDLPEHPPWQDLLADAGKVDRSPLGWIRKSRERRDLAYLWLLNEGEPRTATEIASVAGGSEHAIRETMRRDAHFSQVRPEGTWTLTDWRTPGTEQRYASAVDAVVEVLRDLGPLTVERLRVEALRRYPVTEWRINQCLSDNQIGQHPNDTYDLTERGAIPVQDDEPTQPDNIKAVGEVVGVTLNVNRELLRGSGLGVNRWLTWRLGLRSAPSSRHFELPDGLGTIRVKRATSSSQVSSLRSVASHLGLIEGCRLAVLFHTDNDTVTVRHVCAGADCPQRA